MSDNNNKDNIDLDSILSEINSTINKEVSKTSSVRPKTEPKTAKKAPPKPKKPKPTPKAAPKPEDELRNKLDTAFAKSAKIIEHAVEDDEDDIITGHAVRFIAVTASEVIDDPPPSSVAQPQRATQSPITPETLRASNDSSNISVIVENDATSPISLDSASAAPKAAPAPDVARDNNRHIKKIRKKHERRTITKRQRFIAIIGFIMTILVIVGGIAIVFSTGQFAFQAIDKTNIKRELAEDIFPFVIIDIPEFDDIKKLDNSAIVSSAIWAFIIGEPDKTKYAHDDLGSIFVPDVDIELYIRKLFGNDVPIKHQTVDNTSVMMFYDETSKTYTIESTPKILPYRPRVDKIAKKSDVYTLTVSYLLPDAMWNFETSTKNDQVGKTMEYVLKKHKNSYQVISVKLLSVVGVVSSDPNMLSSQIIEDELVSSDDIIINAEPVKPIDATENTSDTQDEDASKSSSTVSDSDDSSSASSDDASSTASSKTSSKTSSRATR